LASTLIRSAYILFPLSTTRAFADRNINSTNPSHQSSIMVLFLFIKTKNRTYRIKTASNTLYRRNVYRIIRQTSLLLQMHL
jgi:hypothetical protein